MVAADPDFEPDVMVINTSSSLIRDRIAKRPFPALPYVYTGSREAVIDQVLPGGKASRQRPLCWLLPRAWWLISTSPMP